MSILIYIIGDYGTIPQILCHPRCITRYSGIFIVKKGVIAMSNENKIRILYVQPGKYPEERFVANELPPFSGLLAGICKPYGRKVNPLSARQVFACRAFSFCGTYLVERRIAW